MKENCFEIRDTFYIHNQPVKIISGAIHYFRVVPEYWKDRLEKLKAAGCNTVETYVAWNFHEPHKGQFNFEGMGDIKKFIEIAQELGLYVIVRPSPYICAEWEFGGLPAWLLKDRNMRVRENNDSFMGHVDDFYQELFKILTPLQITQNGPIILLQIENEYGYYGNDKSYLQGLADMMIKYGAEVPMVTSDGPWGEALDSGKLQGCLPTGNFGSKAPENFEVLSKHVKGGPLMCMEYWIGWFDAWGEEHHVRSAESCQEEMEALLERGHVNIYMFLGGTNFGYMNGGNHYETYMPHTTSYDYDAALTEAGDLTDKYFGLKNAISSYVQIPEVSFTTEIKKCNYGEVGFVEKVSLFNTLNTISQPIYSGRTLTMEDLDCPYGYVLYEANVGEGRECRNFTIHKGSDRAQVYVNGRLQLTQEWNELGYIQDSNSPDSDVMLTLDEPEENILSILMENRGRINFGEKLNDQRKGIAGGIVLDKHFHHGWMHYPLPLDNLENINWDAGCSDGQPTFYKFLLEVQETGDTFIDMRGWGKGIVVVNGFNIGRYYEIGPQYSLYIPGPLLKEGQNEIVIFETEGKSTGKVSFMDKPLPFELLK